jgi:asparagine synthase (glutamine-hydrolysing)
MAGIAGWIAPARHAGDENALGAMVGALAHRNRAGQSVQGLVDADGRRQVVMSATLCDEASGIALVLDGSIANAAELRARLAKRGYRFSGETPEEVLLRAYQDWDKDLLKHLHGAFAFALWDSSKERLFLARDRFGEKPLYLHERNGAFFFASEVKAILKSGTAVRIDETALWDCLAHRYVPGPRTLFEGIRKLGPATYAMWQFGKLREVRYWTAPDRNPQSGDPRGDPVEGFVDSLEEAVKGHSGSGIFLSGGIDSAVLAALMAAQGGKPHSFSLGFEGDKRSELPHAAALAKHLGTAHHEVVIAPRELLSSLSKVVAHRDAPLSLPSDLAVHRLATEASRITKTVVTGDGCDEVLGGYRRYVAEVNHVPTRLFAPLVSAGRFDTAAAKLKLEGWSDRLIKEPKESGSGPDSPREGNSTLRRALYQDQTTWLPDQLLERTDRTTMAASLQAGMPFLDHRVAEYVSALPDAQRVRGLTTKWILREAAKRLIPPELRRRPKAGWRLDVAGWLRNDLKDFMLDHLQGGTSVTRRYYDAATLDRVVADHLKGKKNYETLLWTLLNIEIWHRTYTPG